MSLSLKISLNSNVAFSILEVRHSDIPTLLLFALTSCQVAEPTHLYVADNAALAVVFVTDRISIVYIVVVVVTQVLVVVAETVIVIVW